MDMKKLLQIVDQPTKKSVVDSTDMKKFISIVSENNTSKKQSISEESSQQLNELAPLLVAGARLFIALAPKIGQVLGKAGKATGTGAAQAAKTGAEIAAKNAGKIGVGVGAYEIGSSVADIAKEITKKVGTALDEKTVLELSTLAFKFAIPAGIVLAILYGGKKVIDSLFSDSGRKEAIEGLSFKDYVNLAEAKKKITAKEDPCWKGYKMVGTKKKGGREVPNCVPGKKGD